MAIAKEVWINMIKEGLVPDTSFLSQSIDMSEFVEYNKINLAEAGIDPKVLVDNNTYPIGVTSREDVPKELLLHTFDTENTVVRNVEEKESTYNKMESVVRSHRNALIRKTGSQAAYNWAPTQNGNFTPVSATIGAVNKSGFKAASFEDFLHMEMKYRMLDVDMNTLVAVLNPMHLADLMAEDKKLYKDVLTAGKIFSFKLFTSNSLPYFSTTTKLKTAFGSDIAATDSQASICFSNTEVMRAVGDVEVFASYKSPEQRGDIIGFQQRFTALPIRSKYIGAIYSGK